MLHVQIGEFSVEPKIEIVAAFQCMAGEDRGVTIVSPKTETAQVTARVGAASGPGQTDYGSTVAQRHGIACIDIGQFFGLQNRADDVGGQHITVVQ